MKKILLSVVVTSLMSGCAIDGDFMGQVVNEKIDFQSSYANREFSVMKMGDVNEYDIINSLMQSMYNISHVRQGYNHVYREKRSKETKNYWMNGIGLEPSYDGIKVIYSNNRITELTNNPYYYETISVDYRHAEFGISITENKNSYHVTLTCPNSYTDYDQLRGAFHQNYDNPFPPSLVGEDLNNLCVNSSISIVRSELVEDSFNSKLQPVDVYANFERILAASNSVTQSLTKVKAFDINKANTFILNKDGRSIELVINVYPYRGGSKVLFAYNYHYKLTGDNKTTYNKSNINKVKSALIKIADD